MLRYGPASYYTLGRVHPREQTREPYPRSKRRNRGTALLLPPPPPPRIAPRRAAWAPRPSLGQLPKGRATRAAIPGPEPTIFNVIPRGYARVLPPNLEVLKGAAYRYRRLRLWIPVPRHLPPCGPVYPRVEQDCEPRVRPPDCPNES